MVKIWFVFVVIFEFAKGEEHIFPKPLGRVEFLTNEKRTSESNEQVIVWDESTGTSQPFDFVNSVLLYNANNGSGNYGSNLFTMKTKVNGIEQSIKFAFTVRFDLLIEERNRQFDAELVYEVTEEAVVAYLPVKVADIFGVNCHVDLLHKDHYYKFELKFASMKKCSHVRMIVFDLHVDYLTLAVVPPIFTGDCVTFASRPLMEFDAINKCHRMTAEQMKARLERDNVKINVNKVRLRFERISHLQLLAEQEHQQRLRVYAMNAFWYEANNYFQIAKKIPQNKEICGNDRCTYRFDCRKVEPGRCLFTCVEEDDVEGYQWWKCLNSTWSQRSRTSQIHALTSRYRRINATTTSQVKLLRCPEVTLRRTYEVDELMALIFWEVFFPKRGQSSYIEVGHQKSIEGVRSSFVLIPVDRFSISTRMSSWLEVRSNEEVAARCRHRENSSSLLMNFYVRPMPESQLPDFQCYLAINDEPKNFDEIKRIYLDGWFGRKLNVCLKCLCNENDDLESCFPPIEIQQSGTTIHRTFSVKRTLPQRLNLTVVEYDEKPYGFNVSLEFDLTGGVVAPGQVWAVSGVFSVMFAEDPVKSSDGAAVPIFEFETVHRGFDASFSTTNETFVYQLPETLLMKSTQSTTPSTTPSTVVYFRDSRWMTTEKWRRPATQYAGYYDEYEPEDRFSGDN